MNKITRGRIFSEGYSYVTLGLFCLLIALQSPLAPFSRNIPGVDSSVFLYIGNLIKGGGVPYLDVFDHKGPLLYLINFLGLSIFGQTGVWLFELCLLFISTIFAYKTVKIIAGQLSATISTLVVFSLLFVFFEQGNLVEEYALPFIFVSLYLFVKSVIEKRDLNNRQLLALGACFISVFLLRPNMIALWLVFCPTLILQKLWNKNYLGVLRYLMVFSMGAISFLMPFVIYLFYKGALPDFIYQYFIFNIKYSSLASGNRLNSLLVFSGFVPILLASISLVVTLYAYKSLSKIQRFLFLNLGLFFVSSFGLVVISGLTFYHYGMTIIPALLLPTALVTVFFSKQVPSLGLNKFSQISLFALAIIILLHPLIITGYKNLVVTHAENNEEIALVGFIKQNTDADDKISVTGNECWIYNASGRRSISKYAYQDPIYNVDDKISKVYISDLISKAPRLIVSRIDAENYKPATEHLAALRDTLNKYYIKAYATNGGHYVYKRVGL